MALKQLEVFNFKSYKGHVVIGPFKNFTCIIGPNGAGKSNVMDAVSFVLGVKSIHLRSSALKDLIYRCKSDAAPRDVSDSDDEMINSESENSDPALQKNESTAYVTAVYENKAAETVRFTRTITKSGSSEYRVNGFAVSFASYNELLERENIIAKARNFLVFQGDVESIASQSAKDLTKLIELISGSLELKQPYDELKAELDRATEASAVAFNKKRAANHELKFVRQSKLEAQEYDKINTEYNQLCQQKMLWRLYHVEKNLAELEGQIHEQESTAGTTSNELGTAQAALAEAKRQEAKVNKQALVFQTKIKRQQALIDEKTPSVLQNNEKIHHAKKRQANCIKNKQALEQDIKKIVKERDGLERELEQVAERQEHFDKTSRVQGKSHSTRLSAKERELYTRLKQEAVSAVLDDQNELDALVSEQNLAEQRLQVTDDKVATVSSRLKQLQSELVQLKKQEEQMASVEHAHVVEIAALRKTIDSQSLQRQQFDASERELQESLTEVNANLLDARVEQRESDRDSRFREALTGMQRQYPKSVFGRITDLCRPVDKKYEIALSVLLGRKMDDIVVDTEATAIECIQYMRDHRVGQATFIPLDSVAVQPLSDRLRSVSPAARMAFDCIQVEPRFERALVYALGDSLICDDLRSAKHIVFDLKERVKAVSLDGAMIHKSGMMSGGTAGIHKAQAQKWSESEMHKLKALSDELQAKLGSVQFEKRKLQPQSTLQSQLAVLERKLSKVRDDVAGVRSMKRSIDQESSALDEEQFTLSRERDKIAAVGQDLLRKVDAIKVRIANVEDELFAGFCAQTGFANVREFEDRDRQTSKALADQKLQFAAVTSKLSSQQVFLAEQEKQLRDRLAAVEVQEANIAGELESFIKARDDLAAAVQTLVDELVRLKKEQDDVLQTSSGIADQLEIARTQVSKASNLAEACQRSILQQKAARDEVVADWGAIIRKCRIEEVALPLLTNESSIDTSQQFDSIDPHSLEIDFSGLDNSLKQDSSAERGLELDERLRQLETDIDRMAPNLKGVEKLDEMELKLRETGTEFEGARRAARVAKEKFDSVKAQRVKLFSEAYNFIAQRIDVVYKELTKSAVFPLGGTAYLSIDENPEPYLEGIKFHAMPPMKRFRDMEALSGGEKTMAALSLLFAINNYKPAPFFVLDEVDAALDPTNVAKVARYFEANGSQNCQILAISLKNVLYERAQSLVGVYRNQKTGGSQVLTLQLEGEYEENNLRL